MRHVLEWLQTALEFFISYVVIKGIVAHWLADHTLAFVNRIFVNKERDNRARIIWEHYQLRAKNQGHLPADVITCREGRCTML